MSIEWGANWVTELEKGLDEADDIVFVLSPEFCRSEWTKIERTSSMADDPAGLKRRLRPLLLEPCGDLIPRFLKPIQHIDVSTPEKFDAAYPNICRILGGIPREEEFRTSREKLPPVSRLPDRHRMPYRSLGNGFIGRVNDLWDIHDALLNRRAAAVEGVGVVAGTGGIGKTQFAIEYVHRFGFNYPGGVYWVDADEGITTLISQVSQAAEIQTDATQAEKEQLLKLWERLGRFQRSLVILDNFPEKEPLQPWLPPSGSIHVLVTTRRRDLNISRISLDFMTEEEALMLLNSGDRRFSHDAKGLIEALGGLPLALELARNFLNLRPELSVSEILVEMQNVGEMSALKTFAEQYADELPTGHAKEVAFTIEKSWGLASENARSVMIAMALLAPKPVPRKLLKTSLDFHSASILEDPADLAVAELKNLSLVDLDAENDPVMHRLIQGFVKTKIQSAVPKERVIDAITEELARVADDRDLRAYQEIEKMIPHAETLLSSDSIGAQSAVDISNYLRWHHWKRGRYRVAEQFGRRSLASAEKSFEPGHPTIAVRQSNLALVLQDLGELQEARDLLRKAYRTFLKKFGPAHPYTIGAKRNLESA